MQGARVRFPVGELRSCMLRGTAKKKKKKKVIILILVLLFPKSDIRNSFLRLDVYI